RYPQQGAGVRPGTGRIPPGRLRRPAGARSGVGREPRHAVQLRQQPRPDPHQPRTAALRQRRSDGVRLNGPRHAMTRYTAATDAPASLIERVRSIVDTQLAPLTGAIDQEGLYPRDVLHRLGEAGAFAAAVPHTHGGLELGLATQIGVISEIGRECGSTAFLAWCQSTCAHYLRHAMNTPVREQYLGAVARGELLAGTGMSN